MKRSFVFLILLFSCFSNFPAYSIDPDREYILTPDSVNWKYEQTEIQTDDGILINTWIYEANPENDNDTLLILAYPDAGNMSYFVYHSAILANAGYTVATFDYRGFGKSQDFEIQKNYLYHKEFALDLEAVVNDVSQRMPKKKLGIWAMSMGTTIASRAYPQVRNQVDFIVGDGFVTAPDLIVEYYKMKGKEIVLPENSEIFEKAINSINCPLLILTASEDKVTTYEAAVSLKSKLGDGCKIVTYEGEHLTGFQFDYDNKGFGGWFLEQMEEFLEISNFS